MKSVFKIFWTNCMKCLAVAGQSELMKWGYNK